MQEPRRKLTTIFAADVAGYARLMEADEEGTLARLKSCRAAMTRLIEAHGGRVVNTWGDGLIAEFDSVVEALRAAIDAQIEIGARDAALPADRRMLFRIGLNLGDVICDGGDIYGDGVNIAARLQASAAPGGIVVSSTVYDQVRNKVAVGFQFLGQLSVKNIGEAVPSYAVRIGEEAAAAPEPEGAALGGRSGARSAEAAARQHGEERGRLGADWLRQTLRRKGGGLLVVALVLVAINLLTGARYFWAAWPLLGIAIAFALGWAQTVPPARRRLANIGIVAAGLVAINLLSWGGHFWAIWPLLGIAAVGALHWLYHRAVDGSDSAR